MQVTMKDRVAVVTGASKGIGLGVARRFAGSGAKVAILARGAADLKAARERLAKDGLQVHDYVCDVSKVLDISAAYERIVNDHGKVDILVNNAGTSRAMAFETVAGGLAKAALGPAPNKKASVTGGLFVIRRRLLRP